MNNYNFTILSPREFELLARDLLQKELNITLESFKMGKDGGIDLRFSNVENNENVIIQAKHWGKSGFTKLFNHLEKEELKKVKKIKPSRYILVTSVELSAYTKESIKNLFQPFIKNNSDIIGKEDLNNLLGKFPDIEDKHYKLWFSSVNVIKKIINSGIKYKSKFNENVIKRNIKTYVLTDKYKDALDILNNDNFLVIIGEPGIGKTSLAHMIIYKLLGKDYQLEVIDNIEDAENVWQLNKKQIFYFDDFLGSNYLEFSSIGNSDSRLINFIERIKNDNNKKLILTSRTVILNQATQKLSKLDNPIIDISKHEINIKDYSKLQKAFILYNHLHFNDVTTENYEKIIKNKNYFKIINHNNFNPRIIQFITDPERIKNEVKENYLDFIFNNLNHPKLIWNHPYEHQIDDYARFLITSLFSLNKPTESILQKVFEARMDYEIEKSGFKRLHNGFSIKVKELLGGFITRTINGENIRYDFFNPSISDFLIFYLDKNSGEKWRILESAIFIEQFTFRFKSKYSRSSIKFNEDGIQKLYKLISRKEDTLQNIGINSLEFSILNLYYSFFDIEFVKKDIIRIFNKLDWSSISSSQVRDLIYMLEELNLYEWGIEIVFDNWDDIISCLFYNVSEKEDFEQIIDIFDWYKKSYKEFISDQGNKDLVTLNIERYWELLIDDIMLIDSNLATCFDQFEVRNYLDEIYRDGSLFNQRFSIKTDILERINEIDAYEIAETNKAINETARDYVDYDDINDISEDNVFEEKEIDKKIINLFESK